MSDFKTAETRPVLSEIVSIMQTDGYFVNKFKDFCHQGLGLLPADIHEVFKNQSETIGVQITNSLARWGSRNGKKADILALINALEKMHFVDVAEKLRQLVRPKTRSTSRSNRNRSSSKNYKKPISKQQPSSYMPGEKPIQSLNKNFPSKDSSVDDLTCGMTKMDTRTEDEAEPYHIGDSVIFEGIQENKVDAHVAEHWVADFRLPLKVVKAGRIGKFQNYFNKSSKTPRPLGVKLKPTDKNKPARDAIREAIKAWQNSREFERLGIFVRPYSEEEKQQDVGLFKKALAWGFRKVSSAAEGLAESLENTKDVQSQYYMTI